MPVLPDPVIAHSGQAPAPHDLWGAWNLDPALVLGAGVAVWAYRRGRTRRHLQGDADTGRARCFTAAVIAIGVALVSPLDAASGALASAHMVQHVLLLLMAAPLLALSAPSITLLRGSPPAVRRATRRWRRRLGLTRDHLHALRHPGAVWLLHVATLWFWHAAVPYDAALDHHALHVLEHASFLVTGVLFWRVVVGARSAERVSNGFGVLLVFGMAMQSVFLSALLTFAREPWYAGYATTTVPWHLEPLADQQLAGVIMWIPAGLVYLGAALALMVAWLQATEREEIAVSSAARRGAELLTGRGSPAMISPRLGSGSAGPAPGSPGPTPGGGEDARHSVPGPPS
ncbi:MAG: cytochrome c oxidase assembly protein [Actinomycetota bacterium]|nr:cytochrome c oxidase assembly protein [Actinomycetota bacterium]